MTSNDHTMSLPVAVGERPLAAARGSSVWLRGAVFVWAAMLGLGLLIVVIAYGLDARDSRAYLLPWCLGVGVVTVAPSLYLIYRGEFDPFHPIAFAAWSYFIPGFFVGALLLACGLSQPAMLQFVSDETYNLPLTLLYAMVGFAGLTAGFFLPYGRILGARVSRILPNMHVDPDQLPLAATVLFAIGFLTTILSFTQGLFGYQRVDQTPIYNGLMFLVSLYWIEASFLLCLYLFRYGGGARRYAIAAFLAAAMILHALFAGNRGSLLRSFVIVCFAYVLAGRRLTTRVYATGAGLLLLAVVGGMIYGTTFRRLKGTERSIDPSEYTALIGSTFDRLSEQGPGEAFSQGIEDISTRLDATPALAVVVSNYEAFAADEERWQMSNNILLDSTIFFVPRLVWQTKPVPLRSEAYGELYFNYGDNSFTMTPMGDLLRNFGPVSVPIGMMVLGLVLRMLYSALIESTVFSWWRSTLYVMLMTFLTYEGTFGLIIPTFFKIGAASLVGILLVRLVAHLTGRSTIRSG